MTFLLEDLCTSGICLNDARFGSSMSSDKVKEQQIIKLKKTQHVYFTTCHRLKICAMW